MTGKHTHRGYAARGDEVFPNPGEGESAFGEWGATQFEGRKILQVLLKRTQSHPLNSKRPHLHKRDLLKRKEAFLKFGVLRGFLKRGVVLGGLRELAQMILEREKGIVLTR